MMIAAQTVVELAVFVRQAKAIMSDAERAAIVDYVAANPVYKKKDSWIFNIYSKNY